MHTSDADGNGPAESRKRLVSSAQSAFDRFIFPVIENNEALSDESRETPKRILASLMDIISSLGDEEAVYIEKFVQSFMTSEETRDKVLKAFRDLALMFDEVEKENPNLRIIGEIFEVGPARLLAHWESAAQRGWYIPFPAILTSVTAVSRGGESLDRFMTSYLERHFDELAEHLKKIYPERAHILDVAFNLHKERNYIAAVPLLISQADGICAQTLGRYLFSEHPERHETVVGIISSSPDKWEELYLSGLVWRTQIGAPISKSKASDKLNGPNRNGILHGSRKHLDFGTKVNSLKALSLVFFVGFILDMRVKRKKLSIS